MPPRATRTRRARRLSVTRDREIMRTAAVNALVVIAVTVALWALAPLLSDLGFWRDRFAGHDPRNILPILGGLFLMASIAPAAWPQTWESELLARALRALAWGSLLYWSVGLVLRAPEAAVAFLVPTLLGMAFTALGVVRRFTRPEPVALTGVLVSIGGAIAVFLVLFFAPPSLLALLWALPGAVLYAFGAPLALHRVRRRDEASAARPTGGRPEASSTHPLDLPPETLHPAGGTLALFVTGAYVLFAVLIVAPGVPLPGPVAWIAFSLALPAAIRTLVRRRGVAHPRGLTGPPEARIHQSIIQHLPDETLDRLDDAIERFLRTGRGRRRLAAALAELLETSIPDTSVDRLDRLLRELPRGRWARQRREIGLASLLGGGRVLPADDNATGRNGGPLK